MILSGKGAVMGRYNGLTDGQANAHALVGIRGLGGGVGCTVEEAVQLIFRDAYAIVLYGKRDLYGIVCNDELDRSCAFCHGQWHFPAD